MDPWILTQRYPWVKLGPGYLDGIAGLSSYRKQSQSTFLGAETWEEPFEVLDDPDDHDDSDSEINLGVKEEPGSLLNYL